GHLAGAAGIEPQVPGRGAVARVAGIAALGEVDGRAALGRVRAVRVGLGALLRGRRGDDDWAAGEHASAGAGATARPRLLPLELLLLHGAEVRDQPPDLLVAVLRGVGGHGREAQAVLDDPEQLRIRLLRGVMAGEV